MTCHHCDDDREHAQGRAGSSCSCGEPIDCPKCDGSGNGWGRRHCNACGGDGWMPITEAAIVMESMRDNISSSDYMYDEMDRMNR